jgi:dolichol-phosphate mannosyltransferase
MSTIQETAVIVIPTYNEAGSIGEMIDYLCTKTFPSLDKKWNMKILVVDGNSPDGTSQVVATKAKKYPNVFLLTETSKDGIGAAYLKGFKYAMEKLDADFLFEMDGDFQHPPETILPMLKAMDDGFDYAIGSRKIKGGSNPSGWGFKRVFLSEVGSLVARLVMFFPFANFFKVTDPTTGFKITRVKGFADHLNLDFDHLYTKSFGYKFQLLFETLKLGAKFKEIPLVFQVRTTSESKIERQATIEMLMTTVKIRWFDDFTQNFSSLALLVLLAIFSMPLVWYFLRGLSQLNG